MRIVCNKDREFASESGLVGPAPASDPEGAVAYVILLIDIGNSRVKWATFSAGKLGPQGAAAHGSWGEADWRREIEHSGATRVLAASVADPARNDLLTAACRASLGRPPEFVRSTAAAAGVRNGYSNPAQLGVDRWVAVIGAWHRHRTACCVVDAGTALTLDAVDASGQHLGGFIVPGPGLMVSSLLASTSDLADRWAWKSIPDPTAFPRDTREAIEQGCLVALAGLVTGAMGRLAARAGETPHLVVTGGAADVIMPWLSQPFEFIPDLVLQGLSRLA
jgi:type III pantothenate kinase